MCQQTEHPKKNGEFLEIYYLPRPNHYITENLNKIITSQ